MTQDCFCFLHTITQHALTARVNKDQLVDAHGRWFIDVYKSVLYLCRRTVVRVLFDISSNLCKFLFAILLQLLFLYKCVFAYVIRIVNLSFICK